MFCSKCGSQVADGTAFCPSCGNSLLAANPVDVGAQQYNIQKNSVRQSEISELDRAIRHFDQKRDVFKEYDLVSELVDDYAAGAKKSLLVWGIIITVLGVFILAGGGGAGSLAFILPGGAMIAGGILMQVNNKKKLAYFKSEYARLSAELYDHYLACPNCPVGAEYANPDILDMIMGVLQSGRADTIKEAINLLLAEANQAQVNATLAAIQQSSSDAAFFAAANLFVK